MWLEDLRPVDGGTIADGELWGQLCADSLLRRNQTGAGKVRKRDAGGLIVEPQVSEELLGRRRMMVGWERKMRGLRRRGDGGVVVSSVD